MKESWLYKRLGEVASFINGYAFKPEQWTSSGTPIVRIQNLNNPDAPFNYYDGEVPDKVKIKDGDLLISWSASLGAYIWQGGDAFLNQHIFKVEFDKLDIDKIYLKYAVISKLNMMAGLVHGATMKHIVKKDFDNTCIPYPPINEQKDIVRELDKISELISIKKTQLCDLVNLSQCIFFEMFGDLNNTPFTVQTLNDTCEFIKDGTHQTPTYTDDCVNGVKFLSAKDVVSGYINWLNIKYIPYELHTELYKRIAPKRGDILLCKNGTTGICAIVDTDDVFDIYVSLALLRPKVNCLPEYLHYAINNPHTKRQFDDSLKGIGVPNLHLGEIKKTKIILPPMALQQTFAEKIEVIERQKKYISSSIQDLEALLASRMQYWFD